MIFDRITMYAFVLPCMLLQTSYSMSSSKIEINDPLLTPEATNNHDSSHIDLLYATLTTPLDTRDIKKNILQIIAFTGKAPQTSHFDSLKFAIFINDFILLKHLMRHNADPYFKDHEGKTVYDYLEDLKQLFPWNQHAEQFKTLLDEYTNKVFN